MRYSICCFKFDMVDRFCYICLCDMSEDLGMLVFLNFVFGQCCVK